MYTSLLTKIPVCSLNKFPLLCMYFQIVKMTHFYDCMWLFSPDLLNRQGSDKLTNIPTIQTREHLFYKLVYLSRSLKKNHFSYKFSLTSRSTIKMSFYLAQTTPNLSPPTTPTKPNPILNVLTLLTYKNNENPSLYEFIHEINKKIYVGFLKPIFETSSGTRWIKIVLYPRLPLKMASKNFYGDVGAAVFRSKQERNTKRE